ncbi:MAG: hypothetical protein H0W85_01490 [Methylotenera sp.]|nr:hypothetical protein [Methylotenera sp.]
MTRKIKIMSASLALLLVGLNGCATMQDVVKAKQNGTEGTSHTYNVNEAQAWEIAKTVFRWEGSDAIEEHKEQHYMLTSSGMNLVSYGAVMGAWIEPTTKSTDTQETVVTKRRVAMNIATTLTESTFHRRFAQAVEIIHKGQPLPAEAP